MMRASPPIAFGTALPLLLLLGEGCSQPPDRPVARAVAAARLPDRPMTLDVTQVTPGGTVGLRIVGGLASTDVNFLYGHTGQSSCPVALAGTCVDVGRPRVLGVAPTDVSGSVLLEYAMPSTLAVGKPIAFQAFTTDPATSTTYLSNVVERTTVDASAYVPPPATNVLILLIDDVGVDRFALYGAAHPANTPVLDGLAAEGMVFENLWAMPLCSPTRAALQTGRYARRTGWGDNTKVGSGTTELDPNLVTLAELVDQSPSVTYSSSYVGKWHLAGFDSASGTLSPIVQGWDWWSGAMAKLDVWSGAKPVDPLGFYNWQKVDTTGSFAGTTDYATTDNVDDALARVAAMSEPWLLQVAFNAAHHPYDLPPSDLHTNAGLTETSTTPDKHRAMIEAVDTEIGRLLAGIDPAVLDRTTTFFLGDNGSPLVTLKLEEPDPFRAKGTLFDGGVRVPLIVAGPLVGVPGSTTSTFASVVDLFPTIAAIAGVDTSVLRGGLDPETAAVLDGVSLLPTLADPAASTGRTTVYAEEFEPGGPGPYKVDRRAIRNDQYKLVVDVLCGTESFHEYVADAWDEGPDLLHAGLTVEQQAAYDDLHAQLDTLVAGLVYDATGWPNSDGMVPACPGDTGDTGLP